MDINQYTAFFHDGIIDKIIHFKKNITIWMESAEVAQEDLKDITTLSNENTIKGKLHLENIKNVLVNNLECSTPICKIYDEGFIIDFEVLNNKIVKLAIQWVDFPPKIRKEDFSTIKIEAEKIWWENIPDLFD